MKSPSSTLDRFILHPDQKLGQGAYGSVYRICDLFESPKKPNCNLVMKVFPKWYQHEHDECLATAVAGLKSFGPAFHGCWPLSESWIKQLHQDLPDPSQEYIGMILDLGGMSLLQYLLTLKDPSQRRDIYERIGNLYARILSDSFSHDNNYDNWIIKPRCHEGKITLKEPQIYAIDWTKENLPILPSIPPKERKLQDRLLIQKKVFDFIASLKNEVQKIEQEQPAKIKTALKRREWLQDWANNQSC